MQQSLDRAGWCALAVAAILLATGALAWSRAVEMLEMVWPVLLFLVAVKAVADLLDAAGVFDAAGALVARAGHARRARSFGVFCCVCLLVTNVLSLDTTVVLLTPVALRLARTTGASRVAYAVAVLWIANVGSLLLPVANLTNLMAVTRLDWSAVEFVRATWKPQLVALVVMSLVLVLRFGRSLRGSYALASLERPTASTQVGAGVVLGLAVAVTAGVPPWLVALVALAVLLTVLPRVGCEVGPRPLVAGAPWSMVAFALGLFGILTALEPVLAPVLTDLVGGDEIRRGLVSVAASNVGNNLPAYLAMEPVARSGDQLVDTLVGVNVGPLATPWASLATLLWWQVCREQGFGVRLAPVLAWGAVVALVAVPLAVVV